VPSRHPGATQGRILESAAGTPELYDFGSRSYNQTIGTFTSLDTSHGSAQNPALLNGYLYANANPATLVDPDGHTTIGEDCALSGGHSCAVKAGNATVEASFQGYLNTQRAVAKASANLPVLCRQTGGHASGCAPLDHHPEKSWSQTMKEGDAAWQAAHPAPVVADAPTPQAKQRDCGFMGIGCVDLGAAASNVGNTVGSKLQDFGGGVGTWARDLGGSIDRQMPAAVWAFAIGTCALAWETALGCATLAALAAYTTANGVNNNQTGDGDVLGGWNWKDAPLSIPSSLISGGVLPSGRGRFRWGVHH
jgi:RHS repeat-associated protein